MSSKLLCEVLTEINNDVTLLETVYKPNGEGSPLAVVFKHAFLPKWKFLLPEGDPPYKKEEGPAGMSTSNIISEIRRFPYLCDPNTKPMIRENVFISILEAIHPKDAELMLLIKDQKLTSAYPKLRIKTLINAGYLPPLPTDGSFLDPDEEVETPVMDPPKPRRGRQRKPLEQAGLNESLTI